MKILCGPVTKLLLNDNGNDDNDGDVMMLMMFINMTVRMMMKSVGRHVV